MSVNKVIIVGNLGQKPELKQLPNGQAVANFSVATNKRWEDKAGSKQERTEWHRIVVWGKQAETCAQYLDKGRQVYIEGELQTRQWEKDGQKHFTTEIQAATVQFLNGANAAGAVGNSNTASSTSKATSGQNTAMSQFGEEDIPF